MFTQQFSEEPCEPLVSGATHKLSNMENREDLGNEELVGNVHGNHVNKELPSKCVNKKQAASSLE